MADDLDKIGTPDEHEPDRASRFIEDDPGFVSSIKWGPPPEAPASDEEGLTPEQEAVLTRLAGEIKRLPAARQAKAAEALAREASKQVEAGKPLNVAALRKAAGLR